MLLRNKRDSAVGKHADRLRWIFAVTFVVAATICVVFHRSALQMLAMPLVHVERLKSVDFVLPVGGDSRFEVSTQLCIQQKAGKVLLLESHGGNLVKYNVLPSSTELAFAVLSRNGLPPSEIELVHDLDEPSRRPYRNLQMFLTTYEDVDVCLLVDRFYSRRLRCSIDLALSPEEAARVSVVALTDRRFDEYNWWQSRDGIKSFVSAWLSLLYLWGAGIPEKPLSDLWDPDEYEKLLLTNLEEH